MISYVICLSQKVDFFNLSSHTLGADLDEGLQIAFLKTSSENSVQPAQLLPPRCRRNAVVAMLSSCCGPVHPASRPPCQLWNHSDFYYPLQILLFIQMPFFSPFFPQLLSPSLIFFIFSYFFHFLFLLPFGFHRQHLLFGALFPALTLLHLDQSSGMRLGLVFLRRLLCPPWIMSAWLTCLPAALLLLYSCLLCLSLLCKNSGSLGRNFCLLHDTART